jgi:TerC family integral membrane protein
MMHEEHLRNRYGSSQNGQNGHHGLQPLDDWHALPPAMPMPARGAGLRSLGSRPSGSRAASRIAYQQAIRATIWSFIATFAFGLGVVLPWKGRDSSVDFFTGFLVEKSLSVDNLFVFLMLFEYFKVPEQYTQRVLKWGILSALVLRGVMIAAGVAVVTRFRPVLLLFALILVWSSYKMLQPEEDTDLADNAILKLARRFVSATDEYDGERFFTRRGGKRQATPLLVVLICIELSDVVFAVDSIPAVVGITQDPLVVYSSNIFALLALRSLFMLLAKWVSALHYLRHAVALILGFVGAKMVLEYLDFHISSNVSLLVITALLAAGTLASFWRTAARGSIEPGSLPI